MLDLLALLAHKVTSIDTAASSTLDLAAGGKGELCVYARSRKNKNIDAGTVACSTLDLTAIREGSAVICVCACERGSAKALSLAALIFFFLQHA